MGRSRSRDQLHNAMSTSPTSPCFSETRSWTFFFSASAIAQGSQARFTLATLFTILMSIKIEGHIVFSSLAPTYV